MSETDISIVGWRQQLATAAAELQALYRAGTDGYRLGEHRAATVDGVAREIAEAVIPPEFREHLVLLAVGGYGRRHLAPHSDIDMLLLHDETPGLEPVMARLERIFWDTGLRFSNICIECRQLPEAFADAAFATTCLAAREVAGAAALTARFHAAQASSFTSDGVRLAGQLLTELEMDCTAALRELSRLEPDLKQDPFLLRDVQRVFWISALLAAEPGRRGFGQSALLPPERVADLVRAYGFFLRIRTGLHLLAGRAEDVLLIPYQPPLARDLGYQAQGHRRAEERFLQDLYVGIRQVYLASRQLVEWRDNDPRLETRSRKRWQREPLAPGYVRIGRALHLAASPEALWGAKPELDQLLEPFRLILQANLDIPCDFLNALRQAAARAALPTAAVNLRAGCLFRDFLGAHQPVGPLLANLHFSGLLGRLLPEFDALTCATQFDLVHQYTVDAHSLLVVAELDLFTGGRAGRELETYRIVFESVADLAVLRFAALLHDCGKVLPGSHAEIGAVLARQAAQRLGFSPAAVAEIEFLIREHLLLSRTSQLRDIEAAGLIAGLAETIQSRRRLNLLLLLTFADMRQVREGSFTGWKSDQLWTLYRRLTEYLVESGADRPDFQQELALYPFPAGGPLTRAAVEAHVDRILWPEYVQDTPFPRILEHAEIALRHRAGEVTVAFTPLSRTTRLTVVTDDAPGLFSRLAGALTGSGLQIAQGWCQTRRDGIVIDEFEVQEIATDRPVSDALWPKIRATIQTVLTGERDVEHLLRRRRRTFPEKTTSPRAAFSLQVDNRLSPHYSILDVRAPDRAGLLFEIGRVMERLALDIRFVKIATHAGQAADSFYLVAATGGKLTPAETERLTVELETALSPAHEGP